MSKRRSPTASVALLEAFSPDEERETGPSQALLVVVAAGIALTILFAWLHLIVATQITSTGRALQEASWELDRLERENEAVVRDIAAAEAQQAMAGRAAALGYAPQVPLYLPLPDRAVPTIPETAGSAPGGADGPDAYGSSEAQNPAAQFLLQTNSDPGADPGTP